MTNSAITQWVPLSSGGMALETGAGVRLFTVSVAGAVTFGAAATVQALTLPILTDAQRDALTATEGAIIFNTTSNKLNFYTGAAWEAVTSA